MNEEIFINRPKEDEPTYFAHLSGEELEEHLATIDLPGLQQIYSEMYGPYSPLKSTEEKARHAIYLWCLNRVLEREGIIEPATDEQGNQLYRRGQRVLKITPQGQNVCAGIEKRN